MTVNQAYRVRLDEQRGFSLFEVVLVVLLIGILMSMAIDRLLLLQIEAEKISVQHVMGTLESAVQLQAAEMVLKQGLASIRKLENTNPMDYLAKLPHNYLGARSSERMMRAPLASWYYDTDDEVLVYKVRNKKYFESNIEDEPRIQLKLSLVYRDNNKNRTSNIQGIRLEKLNDYSWKAHE